MADEKDNADKAEGANSSESAPGPKNHLVTIILVLNLIGLGGVAFLQFQAFNKAKNEPDLKDLIKSEVKTAIDESGDKKDENAPPPAVENEGLLFPLEGFTANLAQGDGPRRFVRLTAVLKFSPEAKEAEFKARKPQIRDTIISILNSKRPEDLLKLEGKLYLKDEIKSAINSYIIDGKVVDVYYVGFQIN